MQTWRQTKSHNRHIRLAELMNKNVTWAVAKTGLGGRQWLRSYVP